MIRTYSELMTIDKFEDRFKYLKMGGKIGEATFGYERYLNQIFYRCDDWKAVRREIIIRDDGCDLGHPDYPIKGIIIVHHLNPITVEDILNRDPKLFDPENLISVAKLTHNAVHFGDESLLPKPLVERFKWDTCPWRT